MGTLPRIDRRKAVLPTSYQPLTNLLPVYDYNLQPTIQHVYATFYLLCLVGVVTLAAALQNPEGQECNAFNTCQSGLVCRTPDFPGAVGVCRFPSGGGGQFPSRILNEGELCDPMNPNGFCRQDLSCLTA